MKQIRKYAVLTTCLVLSIISIGFYANRQMRLMSTFGRKGSIADDRNKKGMMFIRQDLDSKISSFNQLFIRIQTERPSTTGKVYDPNPFPEVLLPGHTYGIVIYLPKGMPLNKVPLIWDTEPSSEGWAIVLFFNGSIPECIDMLHLRQIIETVKQNGGRIFDGKTICDDVMTTDNISTQ